MKIPEFIFWYGKKIIPSSRINPTQLGRIDVEIPETSPKQRTGLTRWSNGLAASGWIGKSRSGTSTVLWSWWGKTQQTMAGGGGNACFFDWKIVCEYTVLTFFFFSKVGTTLSGFWLVSLSFIISVSEIPMMQTPWQSHHPRSVTTHHAEAGYFVILRNDEQQLDLIGCN